jgi:hypothetical protein
MPAGVVVVVRVLQFRLKNNIEEALLKDRAFLFSRHRTTIKDYGYIKVKISSTFSLLNFSF